MRLIYDYSLYRTFLKDYYLSQKEKHPSFSYATFSKQLGLSSSAHIQLILSGKRNLTVHNIHRMAEALCLPQGELEFFEALVHHNQAKTASEKKFYAQRLQHFAIDKPKSSRRTKISFLLSSGILPALLLSIEGKTLESVGNEGDRFGYNPQEIEKILAQLLKEGIIAIQERKIQLSHRHLILHDKKAQSQAQKNFLSQQLRLSVRAFAQMYEKEGKFFAHTFTIHSESMPRYTDEIKKLIEKTTELSDTEAGDTVMQLNIQLFPYDKNLQSTKELS